MVGAAGVPKISYTVSSFLRAADFNLLFAGIPISTVAAGEFSNSPPASGTGASAFIGSAGPNPPSGHTWCLRTTECGQGECRNNSSQSRQTFKRHESLLMLEHHSSAQRQLTTSTQNFYSSEIADLVEIRSTLKLLCLPNHSGRQVISLPASGPNIHAGVTGPRLVVRFEC